jgi:hypothetical protein
MRLTEEQIIGSLREANAWLAAKLLDRHVGLSLPQDANDLMIGDSTLLHIRHSPGSRRTSLTSGGYGGARVRSQHRPNNFDVRSDQ